MSAISENGFISSSVSESEREEGKDRYDENEYFLGVRIWMKGDVDTSQLLSRIECACNSASAYSFIESRIFPVCISCARFYSAKTRFFPSERVFFFLSFPVMKNVTWLWDNSLKYVGRIFFLVSLLFFNYYFV